MANILKFRQEVKEPVDRLLKRMRRRHRAEVDAINADPKKLAELERKVEQFATRTGYRRYYLKAEAGQPEEGRFARFFRWLIENQDSILAFIKAIIAMFGGMSAKSFNTMRKAAPTIAVHAFKVDFKFKTAA